ncbi:MAG: M28 family metallopeptidase [Mucilaginibacter sp.]
MKKYLIIVLLAAIGVEASAQSVTLLKKDMYGIASDATEGRFTASAGYLKAAKYVEAQLKTAGVKPGWKTDGRQTYLQPVPFSWDDYSNSMLIIKGITYTHGAENFIVTRRGIARDGKWVVLASGDSVKGTPAGIILLPTADQAKDWETTVIRQYRFGYMHYSPDGTNSPEGISTILISPALAKILVKGDSVGVKLHYRSENKTGYNIIGIVPGTDRQQASRVLVVGAHLDHIGRIGKHIYNGANDDASGCVAELGAARMLAARPGKRPVIFAFFCGEELNLKGSRWFADHLPVPPGKIAMTVNLEQVGSQHRSFRGGVGAGRYGI